MGQKFTPRGQKTQLPQTLLLKTGMNSVPTAVIYFGGNCRPCVTPLVFAVLPFLPKIPDGSFSNSAAFKSLGIFSARLDKCVATRTGFHQRSASFGVGMLLDDKARLWVLHTPKKGSSLSWHWCWYHLQQPQMSNATQKSAHGCWALWKGDQGRATGL